MDGMTVPILVAITVALLVFAGAQLTASLADGEKRKLKQRLSIETRPGHAADGAPRSITLQQQDLGALARIPFLGKLARKLLQAYPEASLARFLLLCAGIFVVVFVMGTVLLDAPSMGLLVGIISAYVPVLVVNGKRARRQKTLAEQLPEALDFLSRILRAGHSLSTGLQMMGDELPKPLAGEFRRAYDQLSLGQAMDECLKEMAARIESTDFAFFVTAVLIQRQTGGDLSEVLGNISGMIRQRLRLQNHVKAKTAEGRLTGYILTAFPAVMFALSYALNPEYAGVLLKTHTGLTLLGVAVGLQLLGLFFIKKITTVRV
jgi:tight adherence protein B